MESGLDGRNNPRNPYEPWGGLTSVSMESGLDGRNNVLHSGLEVDFAVSQWSPA